MNNQNDHQSRGESAGNPRATLFTKKERVVGLALVVFAVVAVAIVATQSEPPVPSVKFSTSGSPPEPAPPDRRNVNTDGRTADGTSVGYAEDAALVWPRPPIYVGDMDWKAAQAEIIRRAQAETSTQGGTVADLAKKRQGVELSDFRVLGGPGNPALRSRDGKGMYVLASPHLATISPRR